MSFNSGLVKFIRILLFPFSLIYGMIVIARNYLFDKNIIKSVSFDLPIIGVGNLSLGGTGKSPMVEYLIKLLQPGHQVATISRGYKRKTKGYALAHSAITADEIGDEPMQFHTKFPSVAVAVGEERIIAIRKLLQDRPETEVIILDDSFQHRWIRPGFNILLTEYGHLFTSDLFLPTGNLRDQKASYKRADIIVVTKCPPRISEDEMNKTAKEIKAMPNQQIFFTTIQYGEPQHIITKERRAITFEDEVLIVCGIANPEPLTNHIARLARTYYRQTFSDHHIFSIGDLNETTKRFNEVHAKKKIIITTEKDAVKLMKFQDALLGLPMYVLPIEHMFLSGRGIQFDGIVNNFIKRIRETKK